MSKGQAGEDMVMSKSVCFVLPKLEPMTRVGGSQAELPWKAG